VIVCYITGATWEAEQKKEMIRYLRSVQCPDGGWGLLVDYVVVVFADSTFVVPHLCCAKNIIILIDLFIRLPRKHKYKGTTV